MSEESRYDVTDPGVTEQDARVELLVEALDRNTAAIEAMQRTMDEGLASASDAISMASHPSDEHMRWIVDALDRLTGVLRDGIEVSLDNLTEQIQRSELFR